MEVVRGLECFVAFNFSLMAYFETPDVLKLNKRLEVGVQYKIFYESKASLLMLLPRNFICFAISHQPYKKVFLQSDFSQPHSELTGVRVNRFKLYHHQLSL